jgi:hypothetical protein
MLIHGTIAFFRSGGHSGGGFLYGILDTIVHFAIWSFVSQTMRFLFHEFPVLGWVGAAALVAAVVLWIRWRRRDA